MLARIVPRVKCDAGVVSLDVHQPTGLGLAGCMDGALRNGEGSGASSGADASISPLQTRRWEYGVDMGEGLEC
ncbi:MAG: hypothetical protein SGPRY_007863 [Prymnesium sp.]